MKYLLSLCLLVVNLVHAETYLVKLGKTKVTILKHKGIGKTFVHLHQNEVTALKAVKDYVAHEGGSFLTLKHNGGRNIIFYLQGTRYVFDPNRIFTDVGIKKTLKHFGSYTPKAHHEVKKLANKIIALLPAKKIIAVHNNRDYSIKEYLPHHRLAGDVATLFYNTQSSHRNFYFVTKKDDFLRLKKRHFNVALQAKHAEDDGSLSYYLANKSYINVESAYNQLSVQLKMLRQA